MKKQIIKKWGYRKQQFQVEQLIIYYRPETSDAGIIKEVLNRNVYQKQKIGFLIQSSDIWLDLGSNIGIFALFVLSVGGQVICVEPEQENCFFIHKNLSTNFKHGYTILPVAIDIEQGIGQLYLCKGDYNKSRHTLYKKRGRKSIPIDKFTLEDFLLEYPNINAIKMDIEGTEIDILENIDWNHFSQIQKLVFEYSFDIDSSIPRFLKIISRLQSAFKTVHYTKVKSNELYYTYYPPCTNVYCIR